jgi:hypothetical protein
MEFMLMHFNRIFDDEMSCCKILAPSAHRGVGGGGGGRGGDMWFFCRDLQEELKK